MPTDLAVAIRDEIVAASITNAGASSVKASTVFPTGTDRAIICVESGGPGSVPYAGESESWRQGQVQVRLRGAHDDLQELKTRLGAVQDALDNLTTSTLSAVRPTSDAIALTPDGDGRPIYALNYMVQLEE